MKTESPVSSPLTPPKGPLSYVCTIAAESYQSVLTASTAVSRCSGAYLTKTHHLRFESPLGLSWPFKRKVHLLLLPRQDVYDGKRRGTIAIRPVRTQGHSAH